MTNYLYGRTICIGGSTRMNGAYDLVAAALTIQGCIVIGAVPSVRKLYANFEDHRLVLDMVQRTKIRMCDCFVIVDVDAVGDHTKAEIEYAKSLGKPVVIYKGDLGLLEFDLNMIVKKIRYRSHIHYPIQQCKCENCTCDDTQTCNGVGCLCYWCVCDKSLHMEIK